MAECVGLLGSATMGQNRESCGKSIPGMLVSWGAGVCVRAPVSS